MEGIGAAKGGFPVRLNADLIYHNLKKQMPVSIFGICENDLALFRPEF